jgi:hypothetical protein
MVRVKILDAIEGFLHGTTVQVLITHLFNMANIVYGVL